MSDVEKFYQSIQKQLGGTVPWSSLHPLQQHDVIQAINVILGVCSVKAGQ